MSWIWETTSLQTRYGSTCDYCNTYPGYYFCKGEAQRHLGDVTSEGGIGPNLKRLAWHCYYSILIIVPERSAGFLRIYQHGIHLVRPHCQTMARQVKLAAR